MINQTVNMRTNVAGNFGDDESRSLREAENARARSAQPYKYAVAPHQTLKTFDNRTLKAGDEVKLTDFRADARPPWKQLEELVFSGHVLARD